MIKDPEKRREYDRREYAKAKADRKCNRCTGPAAEGHVYCAECLEKLRRESKERNEWFRKRGFCVRCKCGRTDGTRLMCADCREELRLARLKKLEVAR